VSRGRSRERREQNCVSSGTGRSQETSATSIYFFSQRWFVECGRRGAGVPCTPSSTACFSQVLELDWANPADLEAAAKTSPAGSGFDLIVASDVTYLTESHAPLLNTISELLRRPTADRRSSGLALVAHETRLTDLAGNDTQLASFAAAAERRGLCTQVEELHVPQEGSTGALISLSHLA